MSLQTSFRQPIKIGEKIARIRVSRGFKQEVLAAELGISQQAVSHIEQDDKIEDDLLKQIADILGVTPDVIKNFDEQAIIYNINNIYDVHDNEIKDNASNNFVAQQINPVEKIVELYERLLQSERENATLRKESN
jgi:transcriptional regulator with XRE-family HTH domain